MAILVEAKGANEGLKAIRVREEQDQTVKAGILRLIIFFNLEDYLPLDHGHSGRGQGSP